MAENIGEASWKAFTKKQKLELDDAALLKALARLDKTDAAKPEPRVQALDEVVEQARKQVVALAKKKKELGDKPFNEAKDKLYEVMDGAEKLLKEARASLDAGKSDEEEGDSPVLLTTKMVPLLRELRKGEERMHALIGTAGKNTAVLVMRRAISPGRRKLLAEALDAKGGAKYIVAECVFEAQALTFIVKAEVAGLAKRLKGALLAQTAMRLKVRVRGEDPNDVDEDGEDGEDAEDDSTRDAAQAQQPAGPQVPPAPGGGPASAEQIAYVQRLKKLGERLEQALAAKHPESTKLRGVSGFASEKAAAGDYAGATKALLMLEKLLDPAAGVAAGTGESPGVEPGTAFNARLTALMPRVQAALSAAGPAAAAIKAKVAAGGIAAKNRDFDGAAAALDETEKLLAGADALAAWQSTRSTALQALKVVAGRIAAAKHAASSKALIELNGVMKNLTESPWSQAQVNELRAYLGSDDVVHDVCDLDVDIRTPMMQALDKLHALVPN